MRLLEVPCPVCSADDPVVLYPDTLGANPPLFGYKWVPGIRKMYRVVRCNACGHAYCSPRLENMYQHYEDVLDEEYLKNEPLRVATAKNVLPVIRKHRPTGRLLDVGCSTGDFLTAARESYDVEGLELSRRALGIARGRGLAVHALTLKDYVESAKPFDVITLWGVIEHLEHPCDELERINRLLKPDGIVCLWTGDMGSLYSKVFGQAWWYMIGQHIQFFSKKSMDEAMGRCGFERAYMGVYPYVMSFRYLAVSLSRYPVIGDVARAAFKWTGLDKRTFILRKSDEMFAIYRKSRDIPARAAVEAGNGARYVS